MWHLIWVPIFGIEFMGNQTFVSFTDQPTIVDKFNISKYINGLASFIQQCETPLTIAIQGDWGTGKTSIMMQVSDVLKANPKMKQLFFNTWQYSQFHMEDQLIFSLVHQLSSALAESEEKNAFAQSISKFNVAKDVGYQVFKSGFSVGSEFIKSHTLGVVDPKAMLEAAKESDASPQDLADDIKNLKAQFQAAVTKTLKEAHQEKLVIFIDDLDRLAPAKAVELLEALKLFLDCKGCLFVLAIDYEVIVNGVKNKYGADFDDNKGRAFFDKLIQVPFSVPINNYATNEFIINALRKLGMSFEMEEIDLINDLIRTSIGTNPRSMNRLFNSFSLMTLIDGAEKDKADDYMTLLATLCLHYSYTEIYNHLADNRDNKKQLLQYLVNEAEESDFGAFYMVMKQSLGVEDDVDLTEDELEKLLLKLELSSAVSAGDTPATAQKQNHTVNPDVQYVVRRFFNDLSASQKFDLENRDGFGKEKRETRIDALSSRYQELLYPLDTIRLTNGKGQGINIFQKDNPDKFSVYFSGDAYGNLINDGLLSIHNKEIVKKVSKSEFKEFTAESVASDEATYQPFFEKTLSAVNSAAILFREIAKIDSKN